MSRAFLKSLRLLLVGVLCLVRLCVTREVRAETEAPAKPWQVAGIRAAFGDFREPFVEPSLSVQREALKICANRGWGAVLDAQEVAAYLSSRESSARKAAATVLVQMGEDGRRFAKQIEPLLKDRVREVRITAIRALGMMGQKGADFGSES